MLRSARSDRAWQCHGPGTPPLGRCYSGENRSSLALEWDMFQVQSTEHVLISSALRTSPVFWTIQCLYDSVSYKRGRRKQWSESTVHPVPLSCLTSSITWHVRQVVLEVWHRERYRWDLWCASNPTRSSLNLDNPALYLRKRQLSNPHCPHL